MCWPHCKLCSSGSKPHPPHSICMALTLVFPDLAQKMRQALGTMLFWLQSVCLAPLLWGELEPLTSQHARARTTKSLGKFQRDVKNWKMGGLRRGCKMSSILFTGLHELILICISSGFVFKGFGCHGLRQSQVAEKYFEHVLIPSQYRYPAALAT